MQSLTHLASEVIVTHLPTDVYERDVVSARCGFTEHVTSVRVSCTEFSNSELEMVILRQLMVSVNTSTIVSTAAHHKEDKRKVYTSFSHQGKLVCARIFRFLHCMWIKQLKNLMKRSDPMSTWQQRKLKHALSYSWTVFVVQFLFLYTEQHALLSGRIPGYSQTDIQLLPSSVLKRAVRRVYHAHAVAHTTYYLPCRTGTIHPSL